MMSAISSPHLGIYGIGFVPPPLLRQSRIPRMHRAQFRALRHPKVILESGRGRLSIRPQNGILPLLRSSAAFLKIGRISMRATRSRNLRPAAAADRTLSRRIATTLCPLSATIPLRAIHFPSKETYPYTLKMGIKILLQMLNPYQFQAHKLK